MKWLDYVDFIKVSKALRCILQESGDNNKCKLEWLWWLKHNCLDLVVVKTWPAGRLHVPFSNWTTTATGFFEESCSVLTVESPTKSSIEDPVAVDIWFSVLYQTWCCCITMLELISTSSPRWRRKLVSLQLLLRWFKWDQESHLRFNLSLTCFISERSTPVRTLRTMMTMRIMAVKDPMMMPMTRDIVGDIPLSDSIFCLSPTSSSFWRGSRCQLW